MGRILLYTTAGCSLCATARAVVRSWGCVFYEISLAEHPASADELCELTSKDHAVVPQLFLNDTVYEGLDLISHLSESADRRAILERTLEEESPSFPLLPEGSDSNNRSVPLASASDSEEEFLQCHRLFASLIAAEPPLLNPCKHGDAMGVRGSKLVKWLKGTVGSTAAAEKMAAALVGLGFLRDLGEHSGFDARHMYGLQPLQQRHMRSLNAYAPPAAGRLDAVALSAELAGMTGTLMDSFISPEGVVPRFLLRSCKKWYEFKRALLQLQLVDVPALSKTEQRAFFINVYRVLLFHMLLVYGRPLTHEERVRFFEEVGYSIGSEFWTLNSIDHVRLLRWNTVTPPAAANRPWAQTQGDPRVHFALQNALDVSPAVCIYRMDNLEAALESAVKVAAMGMVTILPPSEGGKLAGVRLHRLFRWFDDLFAPGALPWLARYHPQLAQLEPFEQVSVSFDDGVARNELGPLRTSVVAVAGVGGVTGVGLMRRPSVWAVEQQQQQVLLLHQNQSQQQQGLAEFTVQHWNGLLKVWLDPRGSVWDLKVAVWRLDESALPTEIAVFGPSAALMDNSARLDASGLVSGLPVAVRRSSPSQRRATDGSSGSSKFNVGPAKRAVLNAACFLGGRGASRAVVGARTEVQLYLVDTAYTLLPPSAALAKTVEAHIVQGAKKSLPVTLTSGADHFSIVFVPDVIATGDSYRVIISVGGREACGRPVLGRLLDLSNPQAAVRAHCHSTEWGPELAVACSQMADVFQEVGYDSVLDLVLANRNDAANVLTPLVPRLARSADWAQFLIRGQADGVLALAILGSIDFFRHQVSAADVTDLARVGGRAALALLASAQCPPYEVCEHVLQALAACECWLLASAVFGAMVRRPQAVYDVQLLEQLLARPFFLKLFTCSNMDALQMLFADLQALLERRGGSARPLSSELVAAVVAGIRSPLLAVRRAALQLTLCTLSEPTARLFFVHSLDAALREALLEEQVLALMSWQLVFARPDEWPALAEPVAHNLLALLGCLSLAYRWAAGTASARLTAASLLQVLTGLTLAASPELARLAWMCLLQGVCLLDEKVQLGLGFYQRVTSAVRRLLEEGRNDLAGIPFGSLAGAASESVRVHSVQALARLVAEDRPWRKRLTLLLGGRFLQAYVALISSGALEPAEVLLDPSEVVLGKVLGTGAAGTVYLSKWRGQDVAVKSLSEDSLSFSMKEFLSEMALMNIVRHRNVAHLVGGSLRPGNYFLVSRFYPRGALDVLLKSSSPELTPERQFRIGLQVARAMKYLHALGVVHRDLKPANVLVDTDWTAAVCDFGVSRCVDATASLNMTRGVGTPLYIAPEVLEGTVYDSSADVFSFGICLWQTLEREEPYTGVNYMQLVPLIVQEHLRPKISERSEHYRSLLEACWNGDPAARPPFEQVVVQLKKLHAVAVAAPAPSAAVVEVAIAPVAKPPARVMRLVSVDPAPTTEVLSRTSKSTEVLSRTSKSPRNGSIKDRGAHLRKSTNEIEFK